MKQIKLTINQAQAIRADIQEINSLNQSPAVVSLQSKVASFRRYIDAMVLDAGGNPQDFDKPGLWEESGETYLKAAEG